MSKSGLFYSVGIQIAPVKGMVGLIGLEPMTPALSRRCSNQLSYRPGVGSRKFEVENWKCLLPHSDFYVPSSSGGGG